MHTQRLSKVLASRGVASRRACEDLIFSKRVTVNGEVALLPQMQVNPSRDEILVDRRPIPDATRFVYYVFNKPKGLVCSHNKPLHKKIIYDLLAGPNGRLFSVGRLDKETSGLLLLTNDGHFSHKVIHPSSEIKKEYLVKTNKEIGAEHLKTIQEGCMIEGVWIRPFKVLKVRKGTLKIIVIDGKKREVRILVEHAGLTVLDLKRVAIGNLRLGLLPLGSYRSLTSQEKDQIFS